MVERVLRKITNFLEAPTIVRVKFSDLLLDSSHICMLARERVSSDCFLLAVRIKIIEHLISCVLLRVLLTIIELVVGLDHHGRFVSETKPLFGKELVHRHRSTAVWLSLCSRS